MAGGVLSKKMPPLMSKNHPAASSHYSEEERDTVCSLKKAGSIDKKKLRKPDNGYRISADSSQVSNESTRLKS